MTLWKNPIFWSRTALTVKDTLFLWLWVRHLFAGLSTNPIYTLWVYIGLSAVLYAIYVFYFSKLVSPHKLQSTDVYLYGVAMCVHTLFIAILLFSPHVTFTQWHPGKGMLLLRPFLLVVLGSWSLQTRDYVHLLFHLNLPSQVKQH